MAGSTPSRRRRNTARAASLTMKRMATVMASPIRGSSTGTPTQTPMAPMRTAREVKPSTRECCPSAISAAEPISLPVRMRKMATASFPRKPITAAAPTTLQGKGDPERDRGDGIAEVVNGVRQQRCRAREDDDHHLEERRGPKADKRELECPDAALVGLQRRVHLFVDVM